MQWWRCSTISLQHLSAARAYPCTFIDGPAYVRSDTRLPCLNQQLRIENSVLGDRESDICSLVFMCATYCCHVSPAHTTRVLATGKLQQEPWLGEPWLDSRHRRACHRGGPVGEPCRPWNASQGKDVTSIIAGNALRATNALFQRPGM